MQMADRRFAVLQLLWFLILCLLAYLLLQEKQKKIYSRVALKLLLRWHTKTSKTVAGVQFVRILFQLELRNEYGKVFFAFMLLFAGRGGFYNIV